MKRKKLTIALVASTVAALMLVATLSVYAYFTTRVYVYTDAGKEVAHVGMNLQLLFGKLDDDLDGTTIDLPNYQVNSAGHVVFQEQVTLDKDAPWGSAQNPYVISETRHLQNLSALQNVGYFDMLYIAENFGMVTVGEGESATQEYGYIQGSASIPYFLVCDPLGRPVTIDGTKLTSSIKPIGSAEHPFIGVIGGAFETGTTTVISDNESTEDVDETRISSVSTIHGFDIQTNTDQTDVGLFGYVGFLGKEPTAAELEILMKSDTYVPSFEGVFSSIQDVLLSDVSVTVASPSLGENISEVFEPIWEKFFGNGDGTVADGEVLHRFTFSDKSNAGDLFHETHHIGIFAGHVSYAMIDQINVYYSDNSIYALDVTGVKNDNGDPTGNYYSASGILGMMYNMNCTVQNDVDANNNIIGNCMVLLGTGTSGDEIGGGGEGTGTGGGALSGNGRGYVTAAEIFSDFNNVDVTQSNNELLWRYKLSEASSWVTNAILIYKKTDGSYTLADGKTIATIGANGVSGGGKTWPNFIVREVTANSSTHEEKFSYKDSNGTIIYICELMGNKYNGQTIWNFSAGGDGIWHSGIRVLKNGDVYTLDDKEKTTVTFDAMNYIVSDGTYVWESFFVTETNADGTVESYMYDPVTGKRWTVNIFERKPMTLIEAYRIDPETNAREDLCVEWVSTFLWMTTNTGLYYFYDGVFTFGLSSAEDTIQDTWKNDEAPTLYLGEDDPTKWEHNSATGNKAVMAFLTPVIDNQTLNAALKSGKQLYISAKPNPQNNEQLLLMSLKDGQKNAVNGTTVYLDKKTGQTVYDSYESGNYTKIPQQLVNGQYKDMTYYDENGVERPVTVDYLLSQWNETSGKWKGYEVLNIGKTSSTTSLEYLQEKYNVSGKDTGKDVYYDENVVPVTIPENPTDTSEIQKNAIWNGYIYYTYHTYRFFVQLYAYEVYYVPPEGDPILLTSDTDATSFNLQNILSGIGLTAAGTSSGASLYSGTITSKNVTVKSHFYNPDPENEGWQRDLTTVPVVQITKDNGSRFVGDNTTADMSGNQVSKVSGFAVQYYYFDTEDGHYYSSGGLDKGTTLDTTDNLPIEDGMMLTKYPTYIFSDAVGTSHLQLISETEYRTITIPYINLDIATLEVKTNYMLFAGTNDQYGLLTDDDGNPMSGQSTEGVLVFNSDGSCHIRYTLNKQSYYVNYTYSTPESNTNSFSSAVNGSPMYVYIIEGVLDMEWGVNTFIPVEDSDSLQFSANQVVFWPQMTLTQNGYNTNSGYKTSVTATASTDINATKYVTPDPTYSIVPLTGTNGLNWGTKDGYKLGDYGLDKKFKMADQSKFGNILNLDQWGLGTLPSGESSIMVAPVGSNGVEATIPKGCVAFRVNAGGTQTIRVIVAVPTTDKYVGEDGFELDMDEDYYIGAWQVEAAGESLTATFNKSTAVEKFELPRSYTFSFEDTPSTIENKNYYTIVQYGGKTYRTYLNGDCFLVAYEFVIDGGTDGGVFIIGSTHGADNSESNLDVPMEIVHFSVSGTASAGRDGVTGNQLGAIDFVYDDTQGNIATIDKTGQTGGPTNANGEDYANYYASQCLLYSNNEATDANNAFLKINRGTVKIKRHIVLDANSTTTGQSKITCTTTGTTAVPDPFLVKRYAINSDAVILNGVENSG